MLSALFSIGAIQIVIIILSMISLGFLIYHSYYIIQDLTNKVERLEQSSCQPECCIIEESDTDSTSDIDEESDEDYLNDTEDTVEDQEPLTPKETPKYIECVEEVPDNQEIDIYKEFMGNDEDNSVLYLCQEIMKTGKKAGQVCGKKKKIGSEYCALHSKNIN